MIALHVLHIAKFKNYLAVLLIFIATTSTQAQGVWTPLRDTFPTGSGGLMLLLTDG